jgi:glyoxylase-like metal-dependent hydrolase (beta-lactamase superfamily II)
MIIKRRNFLQTSVYLVGAILYPRKNIISSLSSLTLEGIREIRPNVGVFTKRGGTIGWYITDDALVVVDSQFPDSAQVFIDELKQKTERRIDVLFNTHHHGDHTSGNFYLKDIADKIVACENCVKLQQKFYGTGEKSEKQVYAGTTFKKEWELDLGNEKIKAYHFGSAHTGGDAFIHFEEAKVAHMGDLVFNRRYPYMDRPAGCTVAGLIDYLEKVIQMFDKDTVFIFGHGDSDENVTGNLDDVVTMRDYYSALRDFMIKEIKAGKSLNEIEKAKHVPGFESLPERYDGEKNKNLKAAYEEFS